jgi:hypothetical protein
MKKKVSMSRPPTPVRSWKYSQQGDDWESFAKRELPGRKLEDAVNDLKAWNTHLRFHRAGWTPADVIFLEGPRDA